ncbi:MAG TPA: hypothetical protein VKB21_00960 [Candidatus Acidoferrum sp.]|nr:hypothetical protein [Candidatus Acidoferrum sp.]
MKSPGVIRQIPKRFVFPLLVAISFLGPGIFAQALNPPVDTLRNILTAACLEDAKQFSDNLTARNADAFARMTKAAQTTLLKRFVLLDQAGQPRVETSEQGVVTVSCVTPEITTQMQFGKVELRDNLAYLPLVVKDSSDTADATARRVTMGLVKENGQWKLLALGVLFLDLPTLGEEWDRAEIQNNEKSAVASLKELSAAIEKYRVTYTRLPATLAELGPAEKGAPKSDQAALIERELADGRKNGYLFRYVIIGANDSGAPAKYEIAAIPVEYGRTGTRSFYRDSSGALHGADHQGAVGTQLDPKVE